MYAVYLVCVSKLNGIYNNGKCFILFSNYLPSTALSRRSTPVIRDSALILLAYVEWERGVKIFFGGVHFGVGLSERSQTAHG